MAQTRAHGDLEQKQAYAPTLEISVRARAPRPLNVVAARWQYVESYEQP